MRGYMVLLDSPAQPTKRIQIAQLGDYHDDRYGDFSITTDNVAKTSFWISFCALSLAVSP